jgi:hypothetical protein
MEDIGLRAVDSLFEQLRVDDEWSTREGRMFSWLAHRLQQKVRASPPFMEGSLVLVRLEAHTVVVDNVTTDEQSVNRLLAVLNRHSLGSAYSYDSGAAQVTACTGAWIHEETVEWRLPQFAAFAVLQLGVAESEAAYIAAKTGGVIAERQHPVNGRRNVPDDMLHLLDTQVAWEGRKPSRFTEKWEMETIEHIVKHSTAAATWGSTERGLAVEVAFGTSTSLTELIADEPHRRAGSGITIRTRLPLALTEHEAARYANAFNLAEARGASQATHYGAWCWDSWSPGRERDVTLAYQVFIPNMFYRVGVAQDIEQSMVKRARWVDWGIHGQQSLTDPRQVSLARLVAFIESLEAKRGPDV